VDESAILEGETTEIFVSRLNLYQDGMDELLANTEQDYSLPLDVTFTGEMAQDHGGPRKEFLTAMMRQIKDKLFMQKENDTTFILHEYDAAENSSNY
jgi:hypothetical protein